MRDLNARAAPASSEISSGTLAKWVMLHSIMRARRDGAPKAQKGRRPPNVSSTGSSNTGRICQANRGDSLSLSPWAPAKPGLVDHNAGPTGERAARGNGQMRLFNFI
jgi:hypothetical protein